MFPAKTPVSPRSRDRLHCTRPRPGQTLPPAIPGGECEAIRGEGYIVLSWVFRHERGSDSSIRRAPTETHGSVACRGPTPRKQKKRTSMRHGP